MSCTAREALASDLPAILALYRHLSPEDPQLTLVEAQSAWNALLNSNQLKGEPLQWVRAVELPRDL